MSTNEEAFADPFAAMVAARQARIADHTAYREGEPFKAAGAAFAPQSQGVAFKKDEALKAAIDKAIDEMRADGELEALSQKWFGLDVTR